MIVLSLWAIVKTVQSSNWVRIVDWMRSSVSKSIAAVASSKMRILVFLRRARAKHTSCLWPTLDTQQYMTHSEHSAAENLQLICWQQIFVQSLVCYISSPLNLPEVLSSLCTLQLQFCRLVADKLLKVRMFQSFPHLFITVPLKGVQVHPQCAWEKHRLLWQREDCEYNPQPDTTLTRAILHLWYFSGLVVVSVKLKLFFLSIFSCLTYIQRWQMRDLSFSYLHT